CGDPDDSSKFHRFHEECMSEFHTVCKVQDLHEGEGKTVAIGHRMVALFRINGENFAIDDTCPHMGASLSGGYLENGIVTCPWHAWRFCLADGAWGGTPRIKTGSSPVRILGDEIQIQVGGTPG